MATLTKQYTPKLPLEVWTKILEKLGKTDQSITTLWTEYRQVCTAFRDAVDLVFAAKHLPKTWLMFDFGEWDRRILHVCGGTSPTEEAVLTQRRE